VQGREEAAARQLIEDATALQEAGVFSLVLECVPADLAKQVTETLAIPTIGIGSGRDCSGQILVLQDLLGMNMGFKPRFLRTYMDGAESMREALDRYDEDVKALRFPSLEESFTS
jgi:3-methyl-2-oxobutanoate hydroxymethyltransferase